MDSTTLAVITAGWLGAAVVMILSISAALPAMTRRVEAVARANTRLVDAWGMVCGHEATLDITLSWRVGALLRRPYPRVRISRTSTPGGAFPLERDPWIDAIKRKIERDMRDSSTAFAMLPAICHAITVLIMADRHAHTHTLLCARLTRRIPNASGHEKLAAQRYLGDTLAPRPKGDASDAAASRSMIGGGASGAFR